MNYISNLIELITAFRAETRQDAITAAAVLALTDITGTGDNISVARFPYHCLDTYLPRLIRAGHRIAICDQLDEPKNLKPTETAAPAQQELFTEA